MLATSIFIDKYLIRKTHWMLVPNMLFELFETISAHPAANRALLRAAPVHRAEAGFTLAWKPLTHDTFPLPLEYGYLGQS